MRNYKIAYSTTTGIEVKAWECEKEKNVYYLPGNSTFEKPLDAKEGYKVVYKNNKWEYEAIPAEPEEEEINIEDYKQMKIAEIKMLKSQETNDPITYQESVFANSEDIFSCMIAKILLSTDNSIEWQTIDYETVTFNRNEFEALTHLYLSHRLYLVTKEASFIKEINAASSIELIDAIDWDNFN